MPSILIVDDQIVLLKVVERLLSGQGYQVSQARSGQEALDILRNESFDLLISDIRMQPISGMELLKRVRTSHKDMCVIMLTACETVETAIYAMKLGAFDYLTKPFQKEELTQVVQHALEYRHSTIDSRPAKVQLDYHEYEEKPGGVIANSNTMLKVCDMIERVAPSHTTVLISGEAGSGKELAARNLHRFSPRKKKPFLKIDCTAISPIMLETELFGGTPDNSSLHEEGLFGTASGGTLFIHEIGKLPLSIQDRLLQALEESAVLLPGMNASDVDVRIIADSSKNVQGLVDDGTFRQPLYDRLRAIHIHIPPLRTRREDIMPLASRTIRRHLAPEEPMPALDREAEAILKNYRWPGNVNELGTAVRQALTSLEGDTITAASLPAYITEEVLSAFDMKDLLGRPELLKGKSLKAFLQDEKKGPLRRKADRLSTDPSAPDSGKPIPPRRKGPFSSPDETEPFEWL